MARVGRGIGSPSIGAPLGGECPVGAGMRFRAVALSRGRRVPASVIAGAAASARARSRRREPADGGDFAWMPL